MSLWDIFLSSNTMTDAIANCSDAVDVCQSCNVAFEYIEGGKVCPSCNQIQDFICADPASATQSVVIVRNGQLQTRTHTYNRPKILFDIYQRFFVNSKLRPSPDLIKDAIDIIIAAQKFTSHNRGRNLNDALAGAIALAASYKSLVIREPTLSRVFLTRAGISCGRNKIYTSIAKGQLLGLDTEGLTKNIQFIEPEKSISNLIRRSMVEVGLDADNRKLYSFIKALVMIEKLYQYVDQQIMNTKISASIYFYFHYARGLERPPTIAEVAAKLDISPESIKKYYSKLHFTANALDHLTRILDIPLDTNAVRANTRMSVR